jgi:hypothetical protein
LLPKATDGTIAVTRKSVAIAIFDACGREWRIVNVSVLLPSQFSGGIDISMVNGNSLLRRFRMAGQSGSRD